MFPTVDFENARVVARQGKTIVYDVATQDGGRREISVPAAEIEEGPEEVGAVGTLTVYRHWVRAAGLGES